MEANETIRQEEKPGEIKGQVSFAEEKPEDRVIHGKSAEDGQNNAADGNGILGFMNPQEGTPQKKNADSVAAPGNIPGEKPEDGTADRRPAEEEQDPSAGYRTYLAAVEKYKQLLSEEPVLYKTKKQKERKIKDLDKQESAVKADIENLDLQAQELYDGVLKKVARKGRQLKSQYSAEADQKKQKNLDRFNEQGETLRQQKKEISRQLDDNNRKIADAATRKYTVSHSEAKAVPCDEDIEKKLVWVYQNGFMTKEQEANMSRSVKQAYDGGLKDLKEIQKQEKLFANTDFCQSIMNISGSRKGLAAWSWKIGAVLFVLYLLSVFLYPVVPAALRVVIGFPVRIGLSLLVAGLVRAVLSLFINGNKLLTFVFVLLFLIEALAGPNAAFSRMLGGNGLFGYIAAVITGILAMYVCSRVICSQTVGPLFSRMGFMTKTEYRKVLEDASGDQQLTAQMYCYIHHKELTDYVAEAAKKDAIASIDKVMQQYADQRRQLTLKSNDLDRLLGNRIEKRQEVDRLNEDIDKALKDQLKGVEEQYDVAKTSTFFDYATQENLNTWMKIGSEKSNLNLKLGEMENRKKQNEKDMALTAGQISSNQKEIDRCIQAMHDWNRKPPLDHANPSFSDSIVLEQGEGRRPFILQYGTRGESVLIRYKTKDERSTPCGVLKDFIWQLAEAFGKMNPAELLQIHIVDEVDEGYPLKLYGKFIGKIKRDTGSGSYETGIYLHGRDVSRLTGYLGHQVDDISEYIEKNEREIDALDPDKLNPIRDVNVLRGKNAGLKLFPYKVVVVLVPRQGRSAVLYELVNRLNVDLCREIGVIPVYLADAAGVDDRCEELLAGCPKQFTADLEQGILEEVQA